MKKYLTLAAIVTLTTLFVSNAQSQIVNVLNPCTESSDSGFGLVLDESLALRSGNSSTLDVRSEVKLHLKGERHILRLMLFSELSRADGANTANHHFSHLRWKLHQSPQVALFTFLQVEHNDKQSIKSRSIGGAGLEYSFRPTNGSRVSVASAIMPEYEVLMGTAFEDGDYRTRLSCYLSGFLRLSKNSSLVSTTFYQPDASDWGFFRVLQENSLNVEISSRIGLKTTLDIAHNSRPPAGIERTDVTLRQGVTVSF